MSHIKKIFMILIVSCFVSNSFAAWGYHKSTTVCKGGTCHHTNVKKGCVDGHCGKVRTGTTWHR
ncbi:hypothetical protein LEAN103870_14990 [Legionella anisa]|uniref:Uncharacterized protein n=1 Tax=Legionella anisa TaxID=28082 RepID=A0AAX0WWB5_9GAMM|nr:hypothetical protein [Legionella anisa]AWN73528.1 hypothetical protein DLD14_06545 [Legionella anisa]KTC70836.1 hypothetical protein Lani_2383 [Legionella anisa]MCW8448067.1 hypothetical protein [Legionella anisa]PNL62559.1 hypothetical protein A6J39_015850 [Legionella anisa]